MRQRNVSPNNGGALQTGICLVLENTIELYMKLVPRLW